MDGSADAGAAIARPFRIALVLGGGNALGAYHAGVYEALHAAGIEPDWIAGTSIGAVTGAILAGSPRAARLERLGALWRPASEDGGWPMPWDVLPETWRRSGAVLATLLGGRPGLFAPPGPLRAWWAEDAQGSPALYDTRMLAGTLAEMVDFDLLNAPASPRFTAMAVDVGTGDEVAFDTAVDAVEPDHIRASAALLTTFPAVEVRGRLLGDGGLSINLPLDPVMAGADVPTLCIASDLLPLAAGRPGTLGEVVTRMQDLAFAAQSRRSIARWQDVFAARGEAAPAVTLVRLAYNGQAHEVAGKAMDFSARSVRMRWNAGRRDGARVASRIADGTLAPGAPGLTLADA